MDQEQLDHLLERAEAAAKDELGKAVTGELAQLALRAAPRVLRDIRRDRQRKLATARDAPLDNRLHQPTRRRASRGRVAALKIRLAAPARSERWIPVTERLPDDDITVMIALRRTATSRSGSASTTARDGAALTRRRSASASRTGSRCPRGRSREAFWSKDIATARSTAHRNAFPECIRKSPADRECIGPPGAVRCLPDAVHA
jgi:hypothetical protein